MDLLQHANAGLARSIWISLLVLVLVWIVKFMGGFATSPDNLGGGVNDTSSLFNWHPFLMILAFPVFMTEAIFTYAATPLRELPRFGKKVIHGILQFMVMVTVVLGLVAVFRSHTEKEPHAIDNLYSPHSYLGITTLVCFGFQFAGGVVAFVCPILKSDFKKIYGHYHRFFGMATYLTGLATILVGLQEKSSFNRNSGHHIHVKGPYEALAVIPAAMQPMIVLLAISVGFHAIFLKSAENEVKDEGPSQETTQEIQEPLVTPQQPHVKPEIIA